MSKMNKKINVGDQGEIRQQIENNKYNKQILVSEENWGQ